LYNSNDKYIFVVTKKWNEQINYEPMDFYDVLIKTEKGEGFLIEVEASSVAEAEDIANLMIGTNNPAQISHL